MKRDKNEENSAGLEKLNTLRSDVQAITHVDLVQEYKLLIKIVMKKFLNF